MSKIKAEEIEYTQAGLLQLIKAQKYKEFKIYIQQISELNQVVQEIIANVLTRIFLKKEFKDPIVMFSGLAFYKNLLVGGWMDYITNQQLFPLKVHEEIAKLCSYNASNQNFMERGANYFFETLKIQKNEDNLRNLEKCGNSYVLLALELVFSMAKWYPNDFIDSRSKSIFKINYDSLIKNKVTFPSQQTFTIMKPNDQKIFKINFEKFKKQLQNLQSTQKFSQTPGNNESRPTNIEKKPEKSQAIKQKHQKPNSLNIQSSLINKSNSNKDHDLNLSSQLQMLELNNLLQTNQGQKDKTHDLLDKKIDISNKNLYIINQNISSIKKYTVAQKKKESPASDNAPPIAHMKKTSSFKQIQQKKEENIIKKDITNQIQYSKVNPIKVPQIKITVKEQVIRKQPERKPINGSSKAQFPNSSVEILSINAFSFNSKQAVTERPHSIAQNNKNSVTPSKNNSKQQNNVKKVSLNKIQKPNQTFLNTPNKLKTQSYEKFNESPNNKKRSLPKTQKTVVKQVSTNKKIQHLYDSPPVSKNLFNKTLSYFSHRKVKASEEIHEKSNSIIRLLQQMKLDTNILQFFPQYFNPISSSMHSLCLESLNLFDSGKSHNEFFKNNLVSIRLVKETNSTYMMTIHNETKQKMLIEYMDMKNIKYCNRIKIVSWANKRQINDYQIAKNGYLDIKFQFQTKDFNFKFLMFYLKINQKLQEFALPITLLDMCTFRQDMSHEHIQRYHLKGSLTKSVAFPLLKSIPSFLGEYRFSSMNLLRAKLQPNKSKIIGQCILKLYKEDNEDGNWLQLIVLLKMTDIEKRLVQINIMHETKDLDSGDLSKVVLFLLNLLLQSK